MPLRDYVAAMYAAGGAGAFDTLAVNPYGLDARGVLDTVRAVRSGGRRDGDNPAVWVTELGWATGGPPSDFRVSEPRQAELLEQTVLALARRRDGLRIRGVVYFNWRDSTPYAGGRRLLRPPHRAAAPRRTGEARTLRIQKGGENARIAATLRADPAPEPVWTR